MGNTKAGTCGYMYMSLHVRTCTNSPRTLACVTERGKWVCQHASGLTRAFWDHGAGRISTRLQFATMETRNACLNWSRFTSEDWIRKFQQFNSQSLHFTSCPHYNMILTWTHTLSLLWTITETPQLSTLLFSTRESCDLLAGNNKSEWVIMEGFNCSATLVKVTPSLQLRGAIDDHVY